MLQSGKNTVLAAEVLDFPLSRQVTYTSLSQRVLTCNSPLAFHIWKSNKNLTTAFQSENWHVRGRSTLRPLEFGDKKW